MANSIDSVQAAHSKSQTEQAVQPPKSLQTQETAKQNTASRDTVTISQQARQALASNTKQASGSDTNHDGNSH
jgi:hypothetical protein